MAVISLLAAVIIAIYSESALIIEGCYTYQTSPTGRGTVCNDFRPDYAIPIILTSIGIVGILRENKVLLYSSAAVSFARMIMFLSPVGLLFVPSFMALIISAFIYKMGIRKGEVNAARENRKQLYFLLLLSTFVIIWVIAVYMFVQPGNSSGFSLYTTVPSKEIP